MSQPNTQTTEGSETQTDANQTTEETQQTTSTTEGTQPKTFTQEEVNRMLAKERKSAEAKAKLSDDERTKVELEELRNENRLHRAKDTFNSQIKALTKSPSLLFAAAQSLFEYNDKGNVSNMDDVISQLKSLYPEQFENKPSGSADAGEGKERQESKSMNDWLRGK